MILNRAVLAGAAACLASLFLSASAQPAPPNPEQDKSCANAGTLMLVKQFEAAAAEFLACAKVANQTPYKIAESHLNRIKMFEQLGRSADIEAELVALTSPPISSFKEFRNEAGGIASSFISTGGSRSLGFTQARLLALRAGYRAAAEDKVAAVTLAEQALRSADKETISWTLDAESSALATRAKMRFLQKNENGALADVVRAYVRGSDDEWVTGQVKGFPADVGAQLAEMRKAMTEQSAALSAASTSMAALVSDNETRAKTLAEAMTAIKAVETREAELVGAPTWDTTG